MHDFNLDFEEVISLRDIYESGQCFRWTDLGNHSYRIIAGMHLADITQISPTEIRIREYSVEKNISETTKLQNNFPSAVFKPYPAERSIGKMSDQAEIKQEDSPGLPDGKGNGKTPDQAEIEQKDLSGRPDGKGNGKTPDQAEIEQKDLSGRPDGKSNGKTPDQVKIGQKDSSDQSAGSRKFWADYFDKDTSYRKMRERIPASDGYLRKAAHDGAGIRILRQDPWEMIVTFIISQRKNIPAIRTCVEKLSHVAGKKISVVEKQSHAAGKKVTAVEKQRYAVGKKVTAVEKQRYAAGKKVTAVEEQRYTAGKEIFAAEKLSHAAGKKIPVAENIAGKEISAVEKLSHVAGHKIPAVKETETGGCTQVPDSFDRFPIPEEISSIFCRKVRGLPEKSPANRALQTTGQPKQDSAFHALQQAELPEDGSPLCAFQKAGYANCSLGYRMPYVQDAARWAEEQDLDHLRSLSDSELLTSLLKIKGVGIKVASCIMLFGFHRLDAFPVDVWMKRVLADHYPDGFPAEKYMGCAGVMQQYLFFEIRHKFS